MPLSDDQLRNMPPRNEEGAQPKEMAMKLPSTLQRQARLPASKQEEVIADMQPGDSGWTMPWAMYADNDNALWLNGSYTIHAQPGGTVEMRVWRDAGDGYWRVDASRCDRHRWGRGGGCFMGDFKPIPIADARF